MTRPTPFVWPVLIALLASAPKPAVAQTFTAAVESRATSTTITAPGLTIVGDWAASNPLAPFLPETFADIDGNVTHWNSEGYTGRTEWPWLAGGRATLIGRTLQGSAAGAGKAVFIRVTGHEYLGTTIIAPGDWFDRYTCTIVVSVVDWPWHPGDANRDGVRNAGDIWYNVEQYMRGEPQADVNGDGVLTQQDIFDFLDSFFGP